MRFSSIAEQTEDKGESEPAEQVMDESSKDGSDRNDPEQYEVSQNDVVYSLPPTQSVKQKSRTGHKELAMASPEIPQLKYIREQETKGTGTQRRPLSNSSISSSGSDKSKNIDAPLEPQAPIAATTNPSVTSSITQVEPYQSPKQRETVTSRSSVPIVGKNEKLVAPTAASTPTLTTVTRSVPLIRLESVNGEATASEVEESMDKPRGPTASPNEIRNKKR
uniref:Uncharacterized protein n=1 Tax=Amphimedon queenslandica TaxID=400682 RepID=A0A1X7T1Z6_AMPQE